MLHMNHFLLIIPLHSMIFGPYRMSAARANLKSWLDQQQKRQGYADIDVISDMILNTESNADVNSVVCGLLGEAAGFDTFMKELSRRRDLVRPLSHTCLRPYDL